jgi:hypothetical protein
MCEIWGIRILNLKTYKTSYIYGEQLAEEKPAFTLESGVWTNDRNGE